jgi:tetratricopeptide (TPR) repeat protein
MLQRIGFVTLLLLAPLYAQQTHQHDPATVKLGTVKFATSCSAEAQVPFGRAMAWLHSFEFAPAIASFTEALKADPSCAIAYWGIALGQWGNPFAAGIKPDNQLQRGRAALDKARSPEAKTERERDYIAAVGELYKDSEKVDQRTRAIAYRDAMEKVAARYPDDPEATTFYALALAAFADPSDMTYADLLKAGAILEKLLPAQPDHPGLVHYVIHSYDAPPLASRALAAARLYAKVAPAAPHALHMPSHTFTRLGYWQDSIDTNIASAEAARRAKSTGEELHAMDYQAYAYLQTAQDTAARRLVEALPEVIGRFNPDAIASAAPGSAGVFATAAIPARFALERRAWSEASRLEVKPSRFPHADAMTWFARALGAARTGDVASVRAAVEALQQLRDRLAKANERAEGRTEEAVKVMRSAADREDRTEKNAVTPGPIAPARELLGDMFLQLKQPKQALAEFEITLKKEPNRFRALAGAAEAAAQAGDRAKSRTYYQQLLAICAKADSPGREEIAAARKAMATAG